MEETGGSCRKKRKKTVDETHDDSTLLPQENASMQASSGIETLSEAACALDALKHDAVEVLNPLACSSAPKCPLQIHDAAAAQKPLSVAAAHKPLSDPMLQRIFDKHKDIFTECKIMNQTIIDPILEMICSFCNKLENASLNDMMESELKDMTLVLENFQHMGFNVEWLSERVKVIYKMKQIVKVCPALNAKKAIKQKEIDILKQKLSAAEAELVTINVELDKVGKTYERECCTYWAKGFRFSGKDLMYGLL